MALCRCLSLIDYKGSLDHYFKWMLHLHAAIDEMNMTDSELGDCGIYIMDLESANLLSI